MKKIILIFLSFSIALFSQTENISFFPFTGDISQKQGEAFANAISSKLNKRGYKFLDRSKELGNAISREQQLDNLKDREYADIANKLNLAGYVLVGNITEVESEYSISVKIIDLKTSKLLAISTGHMPSLNLGNKETAVTIENIARDIDSKISGKSIPTVEEEERQKQLKSEQLTDYTINSYKRGYDNSKIAKWVGRGSWILGVGLIIIPFAIDAGWGNNFGYFLVSEPSKKTPTTVNVGNNITYQDYGGFYPQSDLNAMRALFGIGVGLFVGGVVTDIVASTMQNSYKKKLEERGIYYSINPIVSPSSYGNMNYGMDFMISYSF